MRPHLFDVMLGLLAFTLACPKPAADMGVTTTTSVNEQACETLRAFNCPEGFQEDGGDSCEAIFNREDRNHLFQFNAPCLANAKSVDAIRACGPSTPCAIH